MNHWSLLGIMHANCSPPSCVEMNSTCLNVKSMQFMAKDSPNLNKEHVEGIVKESKKRKSNEKQELNKQ